MEKRELIEIFRGTYVDATLEDAARIIRSVSTEYGNSQGVNVHVSISGKKVILESSFFAENPFTIDDDSQMFFGPYDDGYMEILSADSSSRQMTIRIVSTTQPSVKNLWEEIIYEFHNNFIVVEEKVVKQSTDNEETEAWMNIPNKLWYRYAVELWWKNKTYNQIAKAVNANTPYDIVWQTVRNVLSLLRKDYPESVPTKEKLQQIRLQENRDKT